MIVIQIAKLLSGNCRRSKLVESWRLKNSLNSVLPKSLVTVLLLVIAGRAVAPSAGSLDGPGEGKEGREGRDGLLSC